MRLLSTRLLRRGAGAIVGRSVAAPRALIAPETPGLVAGAFLLADGGFSSTADELAGSLFGASLFPWLAMLYWIKQPAVEAPSGVSFGLTFLLAFVFGSIPAAIGAGSLYGVSLADADWLHGAAESLLAITNCIVVLGFRSALASGDARGGAVPAASDNASIAQLRTVATALGALSAVSAISLFASGGAEIHTPWLGGIGNLPASLWPAEPENALSVPTWIIHTSSLVEWLVAMGLAWRYAEVSGQPRWRGVTWGMLPLHTSGIIACTYHLFYNAPAISWCVALQAGMTCVGNTTLAYACYRLAAASGWTWAMGRQDTEKWLISVRKQLASLGADGEADGSSTGDGVSLSAGSDSYDPSSTCETAEDSASSPSSSPSPSPSFSSSISGDDGATAVPLVGWEDLGDAWAADGNAAFLLKLAGLSGSLAYLVKYAPAFVPGFVAQAWAELPNDAVSAAALAVIVLPTLLNVAKWSQRSKEGAEFAGDF
jgi:hypothetical protein